MRDENLNVPNLSIVVTCYNEGKNIPLVLNAFREVFEAGNHHALAELIIVDNNSTDDTPAILKHELTKPEYSFVRSVFEPRPGYGAAIKTGLRAARGEVLAWTHGDIQTDPVDVFRAFAIFARAENEHLIIKGNRVKRPLPHVIFSFGMAAVASAILRKPFFEINAQPKLFARKLLPVIESGPNDFSLDLHLLYHAKMHGYPIEKIDVEFKKRVHGESTWAFSFGSKMRTIWRTVKYIWKLRNFRAR
jgi:glycosyltransferase involved in cell wall biosynthesis